MSRGPNPPRVGPSSGSAGSAGAESSEGKSERLKKRKAQEQAANEDGEDGGAFLEPRGIKVRLQGIAVPVGTTHTCLPDSVWSALIALYQHLKLDLETVRRAIPELVTADPNFTRAQTFVSGYGAELVYSMSAKSTVRVTFSFVVKEYTWFSWISRLRTRQTSTTSHIWLLQVTSSTTTHVHQSQLSRKPNGNATRRRSKSPSSCSQVLKECS